MFYSKKINDTTYSSGGFSTKDYTTNSECVVLKMLIENNTIIRIIVDYDGTKKYYIDENKLKSLGFEKGEK